MDERNSTDWSASVPLAVSVAATRKHPLKLMARAVKRLFRASALMASGDACAPVKQPFLLALNYAQASFNLLDYL